MVNYCMLRVLHCVLVQNHSFSCSSFPTLVLQPVINIIYTTKFLPSKNVICVSEITFVLKFQTTFKQWGSGFDRVFAGERAANTFLKRIFQGFYDWENNNVSGKKNYDFLHSGSSQQFRGSCNWKAL
jgi:hypothetical protein